MPSPAGQITRLENFGQAPADWADCPICLDVTANEDGSLQNRVGHVAHGGGEGVTHLFHQACLEPWLADHNTCPVCRVPFEREIQPIEVLAVVYLAAVGQLMAPLFRDLANQFMVQRIQLDMMIANSHKYQ